MSQAMLARIGALEKEVKELKEKVKKLESDETSQIYRDLLANNESTEEVKRRGRPPKHG